MQRFGRIAEQAFSELEETADEMIGGGKELVIWRHQDFTDRKEGSQTASGVNPTGTDFDNVDYVAEALRQPTGDATIFRAQVAPSIGDLIITLRGAPKTRAEALQADAAGFYSVTDVQDHRKAGELVYARIETELDQTRSYSK